MATRKMLSRFFATQAGHGARPKSLLSPRSFPTSGFKTLDPAIKIEEETIPDYAPEYFYPVRIGEVFQDRFQVVAKLGYGARSTVWLCHDLRDRRYAALKVQINLLKQNRELDIYRHLDKTVNDGALLKRQHVRELYESFSVQGPHGTHNVLVQAPMGLTLHDLQFEVPNKVFPAVFVKYALCQILPALLLLHAREVNVTYTDLHSSNIMLSVSKDDKETEAALAQFADAELKDPTPRKQDPSDGRTIYESRVAVRSKGPLYLTDFGEARIGSVHRGLAMPTPYRAPEVLLGMEWNESVDMWSVGLTACQLLTGTCPFPSYEEDTETNNIAQHLACMIGLMGPPPLEFLQRSEHSLQFWDETGKWRGLAPIPEGHSFDALEKDLSRNEDPDMAGFVDFMRALLCWVPEDRLKVDQAMDHPWLS